MAAAQQTGVNHEDGMNIGASATSKVGFFATAPVVQQASANQAALTLTTGTTTNGAGFTTLTAFSAFVAQLENIRASLVLYGILKGAA